MIPRVTFDDLDPRAVGNDEPVPGIFKAPGRVPQVGGPCWVCRRLTVWISLAFEAPVCSAVCDGIGWTRFWWADQGAPWRPAWDVTRSAAAGTPPRRRSAPR